MKAAGVPWVARPSVLPPQAERSAAIALESSGIDRYLAMALARRGVASPAIAAGRYRLLPYTGLKGIQAMAAAIAAAIAAAEKIVVVADYDCDGATACAVAVSGLSALGAAIDFVVPNRFVHGYGLTPSVVDMVRQKFPDTRWIITVDNGIASVSGVDSANAAGIRVLVTDHHLPGDTLPAAAGIVNPNQPGCTFTSKALAGCGVMYYVLAAVRTHLAQSGSVVASAMNLSPWLDLVALGTVADVVPLDENNRWLVASGLRQMRDGLARPGIAALFQVARRDIARASSSDLGFSIGPRLNAAGRLDDMSVGIRCLLETDPTRALEYASALDALNRQRKDIQSGMQEAAAIAIDTTSQEGRFTRVVASDDFHEGVVGIVAGRIKEESGVPTVVFAPAHGATHLLKGSGRSIQGLHLRDALDLVHKRGHELFDKFGGHAMAAGVTLRRERLPAFKELFEQAVAQMLSGNLPRKTLVVDAELPVDALNIQTADAFSSGVWGSAFEEPVWTGTFDLQGYVRIGQQAEHLKMYVTRQGRTYEALAFFCAEDPPPHAVTVDLAYRLSLNVFRGTQSVNLMVVDKRFAEERSAP